MGENEKEDLFLINISVRSFVEFLLRGGDIDNRFGGSTLSAMQEGSRIHRFGRRERSLHLAQGAERHDKLGILRLSA